MGQQLPPLVELVPLVRQQLELVPLVGQQLEPLGQQLAPLLEQQPVPFSFSVDSSIVAEMQLTPHLQEQTTTRQLMQLAPHFLSAQQLQLAPMLLMQLAPHLKMQLPPHLAMLPIALAI